MDVDDFETNPDGTVKFCPLAGYQSFTPFGMMCALRLRYAEDLAKLTRQDFAILPLIMTVPQARELAAALTKSADKAERRPTGEIPQ